MRNGHFIVVCQPQAHDLNSDANKREFAWLSDIAATVRACGAQQPITIGTMNGGNIEQIGSPLDLYNKPATRFVAGFIGSPRMNFITARVVRLAGRSVGFSLGEGRPPLDLEFAPGETLPLPGDAVTLGIRPEALGDDGDIHLADAEVTVVEALGRETLVYSDARTLRTTDSESLDGYFAELVPSQSDKRLGQHIALKADRSAFVVFAADGAMLHDASPIHHK